MLAPSGAPAIDVVRDVTYKKVDGHKLKLDIYMPHGSGTPPGLLYFHGGAFQNGDKCETKTAAVAERFADAGFNVYVINYRLSGSRRKSAQARCAGGSSVDISKRRGYVYPAAQRDARAAAKWVARHGARFGTDVSKLASAGSSAGALLSYTLGTKGLVDVQTGWSGPTKFNEPFNLRLHKGYFGCALKRCPRKWRRGSPFYQVTRATSRAAIYNSSDETIPRSQARKYARALRRAGIAHKKVVIPGSGHALAYIDHMLGNGRTVWEDTVHYIKKHL
ncbi:MAG: alpha/beta hydrolase [Actinomycetota bacterium]